MNKKSDSKFLFLRSKINIFICIILSIAIFSVGVFLGGSIGIKRNDDKLPRIIARDINDLSYYDDYITNDAMLVPQAVGYGDYSEKINKEFRRVFGEWMPEFVLKHTRTSNVEFAIYNDRYISVKKEYVFNAGPGGERRGYDEICNTVDVKTGEVVYLKDLIDFDDELIKNIKISGFTKTEQNGDNPPTENYTFAQKYLDEKVTEEFLRESFELCSEPYTEENYIGKPSFYLRHNRLYFVNFFGASEGVRDYGDVSEFYIELDKLEKYLKVEKW